MLDNHEKQPYLFDNQHLLSESTVVDMFPVDLVDLHSREKPRIYELKQKQ